MIYVLDTNILVHTLRNSSLLQLIETQYDPYGSANEALISTVSIGELYSLAKRNNWGNKRMQSVKMLLTKLKPISVEGKDLMEAYADIDTYSQGKHQELPLGRSSINMGKNDLWIAATTAVFQAILLTTDKDFDHLDNVLIKVERFTK